ncbi:hypothetical protein BSL78_16406 [Apostichopus japonicus]|uniref:UDP-N-acetylglucosamine transferase subunit ALG13 n=1 Tax=Stichopus japonicus TaxID=307972 RepID=A0A2G8KFH7_STIJA|nr:hypothetical protein BSL78_16406 [Apostichopus japonicus]
MGKTVFVTVGTTSFDTLVEVVSSESLCDKLQELGYTTVTIQIGRGKFEPNPINRSNFELSYFRYKDSISQDINSADLVISHAGAGSVLETMEAKKPMIVVINELLMGNHQIELAFQLYKDGHLLYSTPSNLADVLDNLDVSKLKPFPKGQPEKFAKFLDETVGYR